MNFLDGGLSFHMVGLGARAPAFRRCGLSLKAGSVIRISCELSLFHVLFSTIPQGFSLGCRVFPPSQNHLVSYVMHYKIFNVEIVTAAE